MTELVEKLKLRGFKGFSNYIEQIRFPYFKKLTENTKITFDYPFTVLVGPNGSGKTSALQALYGSPNRKSVRDFWFSTPIDPNNDTEEKTNRFIYKYKPNGMKNSVEVIKKRIYKKKTNTQNENPDYWEPSRPSIVDSMAPMPDKYDKVKDIHRSGSRWNAIEKKVEYIDFKGELSAFDKFFYFGDYNKTDNIKSKQDFLRHRSKILKSLLSRPKGDAKWFSKKINKMTFLNEDELSWTNDILGKHYSSAQVIQHDLFNNDGFSILFKEHDHGYSEAVAGSGEMSVVKCVMRVMRAEKNSLILLDEPEVSLHPGAQIQLREMLLTKVSKDQCQVVLSTHSQSFIDGLPNAAIKIFYREETTNTYSVINSASPEQAFLRIGVRPNSKRTIYVEDKLAVFMVKEAIKEIDPQILNTTDVIYYPGGAETIIKNLALSLSFTDNSDLVLLDGDKTPVVERLTSDRIATSQHNSIDAILKEQTGVNGNNFIIPSHGGNASKEKNAQDTLLIKLKILDTFYHKFKFMSIETPEELLWQISKDSPLITSVVTKEAEIKFKTHFVSLCDSLGLTSNAEGIFNTQKIAFKQKNDDSPLWKTFVKDVESLLKISPVTQRSSLDKTG